VLTKNNYIRFLCETCKKTFRKSYIYNHIKRTHKDKYRSRFHANEAPTTPAAAAAAAVVPGSNGVSSAADDDVHGDLDDLQSSETSRDAGGASAGTAAGADAAAHAREAAAPETATHRGQQAADTDAADGDTCSSEEEEWADFWQRHGAFDDDNASSEDECMHDSSHGDGSTSGLLPMHF
jgi:hypothetical protein